MATSFLASRSPEFAHTLANAYLEGGKTGAEIGMHQATLKAEQEKFEMQKEHDNQLAQYREGMENYRYQLGRQESGIANNVKNLRDEAGKIETDLRENGLKYTPTYRNSLINQAKLLRGSAAQSESILGQRMGYTVPTVAGDTSVPAASGDDQSIYNQATLDERQGKADAEKANASTAALNNSNATMQNFSNKQTFADSGGKYATPQEATTGANTQSEIGLRSEREDHYKGGMLSGGKQKPVDSDGLPLNSMAIRDAQMSQSAMPSLLGQYNQAVGAYNKAGGGDQGSQLKANATKILGQIQKTYPVAATYFYNNTDDAVRSKMNELGLGLRADTAIEDAQKVSDAITKSQQGDPSLPVLGHIYENLGFGMSPSIPKYKSGAQSSSQSPVSSSAPAQNFNDYKGLGGIFEQGY